MVDFNAYREVNLRDMMKTGGNAQGGLTVRDVIAIEAMGAYLKTSGLSYQTDYIARISYSMADAMMTERNKPLPQPTPSVEEAFGLDK